MAVYIFVIVCIVLFALALWGMSKAADYDYMFLGSSCICLAVIMALIGIVAIINAIDYTDYLLNSEARIEEQIERRAVYVTMLNEMGNLMEQDVTASETYMNTYDKVIDFNQAIRKYEKWGGTWFEGLLCDPTYKGLEIISLN
jgi:hypothetical protein